MIIFILAFFSGNLLINFTVFPLPLEYFYVIIPLLFVYLIKRWPGWKILVGFGLGMGWTLVYIDQHLPWFKLHPDAEREVTVTGYIASVPQNKGAQMQFDFSIQQLCDQKKCSKQQWLARFSWYGQYPQLQPGDEWTLRVRLKAPRGLANPGSSLYDTWLFQQGIRSLGYVRTSTENQRISSSIMRYSWAQLRAQIELSMQQVLQNSPYTGVLSALTIGLRNQMDIAQWTVLQNTGTSHLLAISGLHIGLMAGFAFFLVNHLWRLSPFLMNKMASLQAASLAAILMAFLYSGLAGFSIPTQRSLIMIGCVMGAFCLRRSINLTRELVLALGVVLIIQPTASLNPGFWLSYLAVAVILYIVTGRFNQSRGWWQRWGRLQLAIFLGMAPLSLFLFQQVSLVSFVANLFAIPWVGFVVVPLGLLGCFGYLFSIKLAGFFWGGALYSIQGLWYCLEWLSKLPFAALQSAMIPFWQLIFAMAGVMLLLAPRGFPGRMLGVIGLLPLLLMPKNLMKPGEVEFTLLDVGQGLSLVVQTANHTLIYDSGPSYGPGADAGQRVILPFLKAKQINEIDMLVVSHADSDHSGGADSLLAGVPIKQLVTSAVTRFQAAKIPVHACHQGQHWVWDEVSFSVLYPQPNEVYLRNDSSCVLKITSGDKSLLLPGDIELKAELALISIAGDSLKSSILVAPHHGSRSSSSPSFIRALMPEYVLFAVGYDNRYRFPNRAVVERYQKQATTIYSTAHQGAITFKLTPSGSIAPPQLYREEYRYRWSD